MNILSHEIHPVVSQPLPCSRLHKEKPVFKLADLVTVKTFVNLPAASLLTINGSRIKSHTRSPLQRILLPKQFCVTPETRMLTSGRLDVWFLKLLLVFLCDLM